MSEIVQVSVGQCGTTQGLRFFEDIANEHGLSPNPLWYDQERAGNSTVYFHETAQGQHVPRAVFTDVSGEEFAGKLAASKHCVFTSGNSVLSALYPADTHSSYAHQYNDADDNGHATATLEAIRRQVEQCDHLQGFQLSHALGGGTGSGLGSLLLDKLREEYPDRVLMTHSVFPSWDVIGNHGSPLEYYNTILALKHLTEQADTVCVIDNQALYDVCFRTLKLSKPTFGDLNYIASFVPTLTTCGFRFSDMIHGDLRKLHRNLVPQFDRKLNLLGMSYFPHRARGQTCYREHKVERLHEELFTPRNYLTAVDHRHGRHILAAPIFRGKSLLTRAAVHRVVTGIANKNSSTFTQLAWAESMIPSLCPTPPIPWLKASAGLLTNHTSTRQLLNRMLDTFKPMYRRKAFFCMYTGHGMDESLFTEALENAEQVSESYHQAVVL